MMEIFGPVFIPVSDDQGCMDSNVLAETSAAEMGQVGIGNGSLPRSGPQKGCFLPFVRPFIIESF